MLSKAVVAQTPIHHLEPLANAIHRRKRSPHPRRPNGTALLSQGIENIKKKNSRIAKKSLVLLALLPQFYAFADDTPMISDDPAVSPELPARHAERISRIFNKTALATHGAASGMLKVAASLFTLGLRHYSIGPAVECAFDEENSVKIKKDEMVSILKEASTSALMAPQTSRNKLVETLVYGLSDASDESLDESAFASNALDAAKYIAALDSNATKFRARKAYPSDRSCIVQSQEIEKLVSDSLPECVKKMGAGVLDSYTVFGVNFLSLVGIYDQELLMAG